MISLETIIFLPAILLLGIITSYQDIRYGKIKNKWIIMGLIYAIVGYIFLIIYYNNRGGVRTEYLLELLTNFILTVFIGVGLWIAKIWTAGDGKLFIAFSSLIPLSFYSLGYIKWFPTITLLINIFIFSFVLMIFFIFKKIKVKKFSTYFIKDFFQLKKISELILYLFAFSWAIQILLPVIGLGNFNNYFFIMTFTIIILIPFNTFLKKEFLLYILAGISVLRFFLDNSIYGWSFLINFLFFFFILSIFRSISEGGFYRSGREIFSREINVQDLRVGMVLSEMIVKDGKTSKKEQDKLKKEDMGTINYLGDYYTKQAKSSNSKNNLIDPEAEGLTQDQIDLIKKIGIKKIGINHTIPFAPFLFMGVLITIILKGDIIVFLRLLF